MPEGGNATPTEDGRGWSRNRLSTTRRDWKLIMSTDYKKNHGLDLLHPGLTGVLFVHVLISVACRAVL